MIRMELIRRGRKRPLMDVSVNTPADGSMSVELCDAKGQRGYMVPGDVVWIGYPGGRRERIVCTHRCGVPYFICTRIGFKYL